MLDNWIKPLRQPVSSMFGLSEGDLGMDVQTDVPDKADSATLALIGVDAKWSERVRRHLYRFAGGKSPSGICDIGDFRSVHPEFIIQALHALKEMRVIPVLIGGNTEVNKAVFQALGDNNRQMTGVVMHEASPSWIPKELPWRTLHLIGCQQHLLTAEKLALLEDAGVHLHRLGHFRTRPQDVEPVLRDAHIVCADLSVVRYSDLPAQRSRSTSGFYTEEICQIMRFAGQASDLRVAIISGHDTMSIHHDQSANTTAQMLWYLIDAFTQSVSEYPGIAENFTQYLVHVSKYDYDLKFHKSTLTGRWWLEIPSHDSEAKYACAYSDYLAACEDRVSERVFSCVEQSLEGCQQTL